MIPRWWGGTRSRRGGFGPTRRSVIEVEPEAIRRRLRRNYAPSPSPCFGLDVRDALVQAMTTGDIDVQVTGLPTEDRIIFISPEE